MNIAYFLRDISDCGGIQQTTCYEINSILNNSNHKISIISLYHKNRNNFFELDKNAKKYCLFADYVDTKKNFINIKKRVNSLLNQINPHIVIIQGIAFANFISQDNWRKYKVIVCEHGHFYMGKKFGLHWFGQKISLKKAKAIITLTDFDKINYEKHNQNGILIKKIFNPCVFQTNYHGNYNKSSKTIISCGTLDEIKRFDHVIISSEIIFAKHPDWKWFIYGDGPERRKLEQLIYEKKLQDNVFLKGYEYDKNIIYGDKSFMVLTSSFEGFGMVLIEAMQYYLPIISYNVNYGPREIVENNINGFLIEDGNIDLLSKTIEYMIENEEKRQKMSMNAFQSLDRFDSETITNQWLSLFDLLK